jgi:hypothetical protein
MHQLATERPEHRAATIFSATCTIVQLRGINWKRRITYSLGLLEIQWESEHPGVHGEHSFLHFQERCRGDELVEASGVGRESLVTAQDQWNHH